MSKTLDVIIKNFKKIDEFDGSFESGNVYMVKAGNAKGKTSFTQALHTICKAENGNKDLVTHGETEGHVVGNFVGADGDTYNITFNFATDKEDKFILVKPDTSTTRKVTDIRQIFQYNPFTAEEFFQWGLTEAGRKKQAKIILDLISKEAQQKIAVIDSKINESTGSVYMKRKDLNLAMQGFQKAADAIILTPPELAASEKTNAASLMLTSLKAELSEIESNSNDALIENYNQQQIAIQQRATDLKANNTERGLSIKKLKDDAEAQIAALEEKIKIYDSDIAALKTSHKLSLEAFDKETEALDKKIADLTVVEKTVDDVDELKANIQKGEDFMTKVGPINIKVEQKKANIASYEEKKVEWEKVDKELEDLRAERKTIFVAEKMPIANIHVEEDGLYYMDAEGNKMAFNENSISYAEGGLVAAQIVCEINKKIPIICIGKASEYDSVSKQKLANLAKQYDAIMFMDCVTETPEELHIETLIIE